MWLNFGLCLCFILSFDNDSTLWCNRGVNYTGAIVGHSKNFTKVHLLLFVYVLFLIASMKYA